MDWNDQPLVAAVVRQANTTAFWILRDHGLAEDAAQEALLRLWLASRVYTIRSPEGMVSFIAQREALRLLRREERRRAAYSELAAEEPTSMDGAGYVDTQGLSAERVQRVFEIVAHLVALTPLQRGPIVRQSRGLRDFEIAQLEGRSQGTVRDSRNKGYAKLESALTQWDFYEVEQSCDDLGAIEGLTLVNVICAMQPPGGRILDLHFRRGHPPERIAVDLSLVGGPAAVMPHIQEGPARVQREVARHGWPRGWPFDEVSDALSDMRVVAIRVSA